MSTSEPRPAGPSPAPSSAPASDPAPGSDEPTDRLPVVTPSSQPRAVSPRPRAVHCAGRAGRPARAGDVAALAFDLPAVFVPAQRTPSPVERLAS